MKKKSLLCILLAAALLILSACSASKSGQTQEKSEGFLAYCKPKHQRPRTL